MLKMHAFVIFVAGIVGLASAQSKTTLFLPGINMEPILASVVGSDTTATTYALACPSDESLDNCGVPPSFTLTQGPATAHYTYSVYGSFEEVDCSLGGTTIASCTIKGTAVESSSSSISSTILSGATLASQFQIVTFTDNLPTATDSAQTSSSSGGLSATVPGGQSLSGVTLLTGSSQSPSASQTSIQTSAVITSMTSTSGTSSVTAATKTSTAGMAQITGNSGWAVGGVALALAFAGL